MTLTRAQIWREARPFVGPAAIVAIYLVARQVFAAIAGSHGLITPSGGLDSVQVVAGAVTLAMRLFVLVIVAFAVVYRLVMRLARPWREAPGARDPR